MPTSITAAKWQMAWRLHFQCVCLIMFESETSNRNRLGVRLRESGVFLRLNPAETVYQRVGWHTTSTLEPCLQGIANGIHWFYENAGSMRPETIPRIIGSGNGLRKNPLLVQIMSKTFDRPVFLPAHQEEAAFGTALLAGSMNGVWPDLKAAGEHIRLVSATDDTVAHH